MLPETFHNQADTSHWGAARAAAEQKQQYIHRLQDELSSLESKPGSDLRIREIYNEISRAGALPPLQFVFDDRCAHFDWGWYWRDYANVSPQRSLLNEARNLGPAFVAIYESHRMQAGNPYFPAC